MYRQLPHVGPDVAQNWFRRAPNGSTVYERHGGEEGNENGDK